MLVLPLLNELAILFDIANRHIIHSSNAARGPLISASQSIP